MSGRRNHSKVFAMVMLLALETTFAADITGFRRFGRCDDTCSYNNNHVCGSDGITYTNECIMRLQNCLARKTNVFKVYDGECARGGKCEIGCPFNPDIVDYVCGSDGISYINECVLRAQSCRAGTDVYKLYKGKCASCEPSCPLHNIDYVCGSDGVTYTNECIMRVESCKAGKINVSKVSDGKCGIV